MTNNKNAKRSLLLSALSLLLCVSMLIGSTFAWFTDAVTSNKNQIIAGNLDVELEYKKVVNGKLTTDWVTVQGKSDLFDPDALWEPGHAEVVYLKVSNLGSLALKYQLGVNFKETPGTNAKGDSFLLSDYLVFKTLLIEENDVGKYTREWITNEYSDADMGLKDYNGKTTALNPEGKTIVENVDHEDYVALIVYMPETVGNVANYKTSDDPSTPNKYAPKIELGINLFATQKDAESDSFGPDYDEEAWADGMKVYNAADLISALANEDKVVLVNDIEAPEVIKLEKNVAINLNGKTLSASLDVSDDVEINIENGKITNDDKTVSGIQVNKGKVTLTDVEITSDRHGVRVEGGEVVINDGIYKVSGSGLTQHALNVSDGGKVTINGGTFIGPKGQNADSGSAVCVQANSTVIINGGNFSKGLNSTLGGAGSLTVYGGTFDQNPAAYVATGYKAVASNGKYVVVADTIADENVVGTPDELKTALSGAADAGSGDNTLYLTGDIDLSGSSWTPINVDGYHGAGVITIEGNGATIKGLDAPLFDGGFAGKSGIVIKNLTIADSNITGGTQGGGAFIDCADSMHVITLENCHLVNSTVTGERAGGLIGWCSGYAKLNDGPVKAYVTISNCSVVDSKVIGNGSAGGIAGHPGASDYTYTTIEDCLVKNVDVISYEPVSSWRTGAIVGTANNGHVVINNVTVEDVTLTQDGVTAEETKLYGRFVPSGTGTLVIDGTAVLANATSEGLKNAIASGDADVYLPAGEYKMPSSATTGEVNISGTKETVLDVTLGAYMDQADNVTITGVTIKTGTGKANGNGSDYAALYAKNVTYVDCTFVGPMRVGRDGAKFVNCTFTQLGNDYVWTYGNDVTFEGCTFNTDGKAVLIYSDGGNEISKVSVKNCVFNSTKGAKAGAIANQNCAAIEIHNFGNGANLVTEGNTYHSNFSGEWRIKEYVNGRPQIIVNGTEYTTIAIDGKTMTIDANKNVTVNP